MTKMLDHRLGEPAQPDRGKIGLLLSSPFCLFAKLVQVWPKGAEKPEAAVQAL